MRGESGVRTICRFPPVRPAPTDRLHSEVWPTKARVSPPTDRPPVFLPEPPDRPFSETCKLFATKLSPRIGRSRPSLLSMCHERKFQEREKRGNDFAPKIMYLLGMKANYIGGEMTEQELNAF